MTKERFQTMERRLYWMIATPAGLLALVSGVVLVVLSPVFLKQGWLHSKLLGVIGLVFLHWKALPMMRKLSAGETYSNFGLRVLNEVPTLLMIGIVILVVLKPF